VEVILLEKIRGLGKLGDKVKIKPGYGRNYLVPYGKAAYATPENVKKFEARRAEFEKTAAEHQSVAQKKLQALLDLGTIVIPARAGDEGKLFGSIGTRDLAAAITKAGVGMIKSEIHLPTGALRQTGEYEIAIELHSDVNAMIKINIVPEA
jgi:large subunit ribosomal protein L9